MEIQGHFSGFFQKGPLGIVMGMGLTFIAFEGYEIIATVSGLLFLVVAVFMPLEMIGIASSLLFLLTFTLVNAALIMYRRRSPSQARGFRVPLFPLTPILGVITSAGLAVFQLVKNP